VNASVNKAQGKGTEMPFPINKLGTKISNQFRTVGNTVSSTWSCLSETCFGTFLSSSGAVCSHGHTFTCRPSGYTDFIYYN
jgi:hypothetical protein